MNRICMTAAAALLAASTLSGCTAVLIAGAAGAGAASVVGERRTMGTMIDDSAIESVAKDEIKSLDEIGYRSSNIGTTSVDGILLVHGQTRSQAIMQDLEKTCMKIKGVRKVHNALVTGENVGVGQSSKDSWITTKLKTKLIGESGINTNSFKVVTENSVVYLMGVVTREEGERAAQVAAATDGVSRVVKLYRYIGAETGDTQDQQAVSTEIETLPAPSGDSLTSDTIEVTDL